MGCSSVGRTGGPARGLPLARVGRFDGLLALGCAFHAIPPCSQLERPSEAEAHALARELARAQVQQGCHALAPDILRVSEPAQQTITVRIGDSLPDWTASDSEAPSEAP